MTLDSQMKMKSDVEAGRCFENVDLWHSDTILYTQFKVIKGIKHTHFQEPLSIAASTSWFNISSLSELPRCGPSGKSTWQICLNKEGYSSKRPNAVTTYAACTQFLSDRHVDNMTKYLAVWRSLVNTYQLLYRSRDSLLEALLNCSQLGSAQLATAVVEETLISLIQSSQLLSNKRCKVQL